MKLFADTRILLVDDDAALLEILTEWLLLFGARVDTATEGLQALLLAKQQAYDLIVLDLHLPNLNGLQLLTFFKEIDPTVEVVVLTGQATIDDAISALREGRAFDFLRKPIHDFQALNDTLEKALARRSAARAVGRPTAAMEVPAHVEPLSAREQEIVRLLAEGLDNRQIADRLILSEKTVKNHLSRIYEKLKVANRTQAVVECKMYGFIS
jgi:DNA-binding NarL/FixJ family response regulator